ncbi:hypothetical protein F5B19DRAFT_488585 [Rostrohypoxylon terebratum]|nr:hypothetical protein F5B19DRAFT_488585 [Rostrohypoxylon terebratum]
MTRKRPHEEGDETLNEERLLPKDPKLQKLNNYEETEFAKNRLAMAAVPKLPVMQTTHQHQFEDALVDAYDLRGSNGLWDCIQRCDSPAENMRPVHIVSPSFGNDYMREIFGVDELYSPRNGLVLNNVVKSAMEASILVIVPNIPNQPTPEEVAAWRASNPCEYRIRIVKPEVKAFRQDYGNDHADYIASLNDHPLVFKNSFRPRQRYLYFLFHMTMLRRATGLADGRALVQIFRYHHTKFNQEYWGVEDVNLKGELREDAPSSLQDPTDVKNVRAALASSNVCPDGEQPSEYFYPDDS